LQPLTVLTYEKLQNFSSLPILAPDFRAISGVQLFLFLNDLAGRVPLLDQLARWFYIGAVPLLATLFLAQLLVVPRDADAPARSRIAFSVAFALLLLAFLWLGLELFAQSLNLGVLSPRPFMTRRVNLLVVEPQDNSFPCSEVAIAAIFAVGMAFFNRKWGIVGGALTVLLMLTRMFCGTNYFADVAVGALLGVGVTALCGSLFEARLRLFASKPSLQGMLASSALLLTCAGIYLSLAATPRFASKLPNFWKPATAAPSAPLASSPEAESAGKSTRAARGVLQEGEGVGDASAAEPSAEELALSKRSHLFLPEVEKFLRGHLTSQTRPFRLLDVEVAPVKAGESPYRCAAIRFEILPTRSDARLLTTQIAARLVKSAFKLDSQLQNVDVTAIVRGNGAQIDGSLMNFAGDEVPVFTASIQRRNLIVAAPRWANAPNLDSGSWLRTRSRLYINDRILPASKENLAEPVPTPAMPGKATVTSNGTAAKPVPAIQTPRATQAPSASKVPPGTQAPQ
jgi:membrane-associated phospholipid phosphatase